MAKVWVEISQKTGRAITIFKNKKATLRCEGTVQLQERELAVNAIRLAVFERDGYQCMKCGKELSFRGGELDERQARGTTVKLADDTYQSGQVSVENCQVLCRKCHTGAGGKHDRAPSFTTSETRKHHWHHPVEPSIT
jgi:5-methylcytosine-specific restriction endonuclease McrA